MPIDQKARVEFVPAGQPQDDWINCKNCNAKFRPLFGSGRVDAGELAAAEYCSTECELDARGEKPQD